MTPKRELRIRVADPGASEVDGNVDYTVLLEKTAAGFISQLDTWGGGRVKPLRGQAESLPWSFTLGESQLGEELTSRLASGGRPDHLGRLIDFSTRAYGSSDPWTVRATARIADLRQASSVGAYTYQVRDELKRARDQKLFEGQNSTTVNLTGPIDQWWKKRRATRITARVDAVDSGSGVVKIIPDGELSQLGFLNRAHEMIKEDVVASPGGGQSNFRHLVAHLDGTDHPVERIGPSPAGNPVQTLLPQSDGGPETPADQRSILELHLVWDGALPSVGETFEYYAWMKGHDPTDKIPYHIGGAQGVDVFAFMRDTLQDLGVRVDTTEGFAAYDPVSNPNGLVGHPRFSRGWWRIMRVEPALEWFEKEILGPLGVVLYKTADGRLTPRILRQPEPSQHDTTSMFTLDDDVLVGKPPTWQLRGSEQVTVVRFEQRRVVQGGGPGEVGETGFDGLLEETIPWERTADVLDQGLAPEKVQEYSVGWFHDQVDMERFVDVHANAIFDAHAHGPQVSECEADEAAEDIRGGDLVKVDSATYPSIGDGTRGEPRVVRVLEAEGRIGGPRFTVMDVGPALQPLSAPSIAVAQNADQPKTVADVTISGLDADADGYELQVAIASVEPGQTSDRWTWVGSGDQAETTEIGELPTGNDMFFRVRARGAGRAPSVWTVSSVHSTAGLAAPTNPVTSDITGGGITLTVDVNEPDVPHEFLLDGTRPVGAVLDPEGESQLAYRFTGLSPNTQYTLGCRARDPQGGVSSTTSVQASTVTDPGTAPNVLGAAILIGRP